MTKTCIIAEAGSNHNKNFEQSKLLIDIAKKSGADICKFQTYSSNTLYSKYCPDFANYKNVPELIKNIELPREWQPELKKYCDEKNIEFMSTPFDEKAVEELVNLNVKRLKVSGFESTDIRFLDMVASSKLPLIISIGIGFQEKHFKNLLKIIEKHQNKFSLLYCNNAYPTPIEDAGIPQLQKYCLTSSFEWGLSDHTESTLTPSFAVIAGAKIIEKHFTINKKLYGPDHKFALNPEELNQMVEYVRYAEKALSHIPSNNSVSKSEYNFSAAMRSVVAKCKIKKGDVYSEQNITTKRPYLEGNVHASNYNDVIGKISNSNYNPDEFIKL